MQDRRPRLPAFATSFEAGDQPFTTVRNNSTGVALSNVDTSPTRTGVRSLRYGMGSPSHAARTDATRTWKQGDLIEVWVQLQPQTAEAPNEARLGGICIANADTSDFFGVLLDIRNASSGATAALQIRENISSAATSTATGVATTERIAVSTWYRLVVSLTGTQVVGKVYSTAGALIGTVERTLTSFAHPTRIQAGLYSYGWSVFDDYSVTPV